MKGWMVFFIFVFLAIASASLVVAATQTRLLNAEDVVVIGTRPLPDASVTYCENQGYLADTRTDSTGKESKVCVFGDGVECKTVDFMRGGCGRGYVNNEKNGEVLSWAERIQERLRTRDCEEGCMLKVDGEDVDVTDLGGQRREIVSNKISARTGLNLSAEDVEGGLMLRAYLSNGRWALVKRMPDAASETALEAMKAKCGSGNCTIELKEVPVAKKARLAYEVKAEKESKILLLFKKRTQISAQVDAESGEVIAVKRPWWAFLASEKDE